MTRDFEWEMFELRSQMSTTATAVRLDVDPDTIKDAEKWILDTKYRRVDLKGVRMIGIDELYVFGNERSNRKYITVARDMETSAVLNVYAADRKRRRVMPPCEATLTSCRQRSCHISPNNRILRKGKAVVRA